VYPEWDEDEYIQGFGGKSRSPLGRPRRRSEDNIKMDFREIRCSVCTGFIWLRIRDE
jgi:hypothetical protein